jgi:FMN-dependent NADH-azoreductase
VRPEFGQYPLASHFEFQSGLGRTDTSRGPAQHAGAKIRFQSSNSSTDTLVIGAPMYNVGIASTLKTWFDHVLRPGITNKYGASGPMGLLEGKRAIVV